MPLWAFAVSWQVSQAALDRPSVRVNGQHIRMATEGGSKCEINRTLALRTGRMKEQCVNRKGPVACESELLRAFLYTKQGGV